MRRHQEAPRASELTSIWFLITREFGQPPKEAEQMTAETEHFIEQMDENMTAGAASHMLTEWHAIYWYHAHRNVRRLQARIVKATQEGRWGKVKALQRLLTHSFAGRALAVKRVTENQGKRTPGVDRVIWDTPARKWTAVHNLRQRGYRPLPLRRVYIPKSSNPKKLRPLG